LTKYIHWLLVFQLIMTMDYPAVEQLIFQIPADQLEAYFVADAMTWTPFLASVPGYGGKIQSYDTEEVAGGGNVTVNCLVFWESFDSWKGIPIDSLDSVNQEFVAAYGSDPIPIPQPNDDGWRVYQNNSCSAAVGCTLSSSIGTTMCTQPNTCNSCDVTGTDLAIVISICAVLLVVAGSYILYLRNKIQNFKIRDLDHIKTPLTS
jgi:uncharacterized protein (TIGR03792 family)